MEYEIERVFDRVIDKAIKERSLKLKDYLQSVKDCGGQVFNYSQTKKLYDKHRDDCESWLENLEIEKGIKPEDIFPNWDYAVNSKENKRHVIVAMFKEYCSSMLEMILILEKINKL